MIRASCQRLALALMKYASYTKSSDWDDHSLWIKNENVSFLTLYNCEKKKEMFSYLIWISVEILNIISSKRRIIGGKKNIFNNGTFDFSDKFKIWNLLSILLKNILIEKQNMFMKAYCFMNLFFTKGLLFTNLYSKKI